MKVFPLMWDIFKDFEAFYISEMWRLLENIFRGIEAFLVNKRVRVF
jgi:hypothetical protein